MYGHSLGPKSEVTAVIAIRFNAEGRAALANLRNETLRGVPKEKLQIWNRSASASSPMASADVETSRVRAFFIGGPPSAIATWEVLGYSESIEVDFSREPAR